MDNILKQIRQELQANIDEKTISNSQKFFRESIMFYGVKVVTVTKISKKYFSLIKGQPKNAIFSLCEQLFQSGYLEESFIACNLSYYLHEQYEETDFALFANWLEKYISNWASCDTLCNHTIGTFIEMYPQYVKKLIKWADSPNRWVKRGAAVTLIIPARKGLFLPEIFSIADKLLLDKDDLVQKGYGWLLKATSEAQQKAVFDFVMKNKQIMPRTSLRYAIEKMPKELKAQAMAK